MVLVVDYECPRGHVMLLTTTEHLPKEYSGFENILISCDSCKARIYDSFYSTESKSLFLHCSDCGYDLCMHCISSDNNPTENSCKTHDKHKKLQREHLEGQHAFR